MQFETHQKRCNNSVQTHVTERKTSYVEEVTVYSLEKENRGFVASVVSRQKMEIVIDIKPVAELVADTRCATIVPVR